MTDFGISESKAFEIHQSYTNVRGTELLAAAERKLTGTITRNTKWPLSTETKLRLNRIWKIVNSAT